VIRLGDERRGWLYRGKLYALLQARPFPPRDGSGSGWLLRDTQHHVAVLELSKESWLVAGIIPGVERQTLKKIGADENELLKLLDRWRKEATKAGHAINRIAVAFEAGRDGFWLARWLRV